MRDLIILLSVFLTAFPSLAGKTTFNDGWKFRLSENRDWQPVNIPHTWNTDAYADKDYHKGKAFYNKTFLLNPSDSARKFYLRFEGVSKRADIRINGKEAGHHDGGYTSFALDITPFVKFTTNNEIEIDVDNSCVDVPPVFRRFHLLWGNLP